MSCLSLNPFCCIAPDGQAPTHAPQPIQRASFTFAVDFPFLSFSNSIALYAQTEIHVAQPEQTGSVTIGDHNVFREHVTIHRGLKSDGSTTIGDHNYLMGAAHLGHDVIMGNNCICANGTFYS